MSGDLTVELAGETLCLLPERAVHWRSTLLIADTHWGKAATLRANAVPVPHGTTAEDLARLSSALARTGAERLVILGDVIHARQGRSPATLGTLARWRERHPGIAILLVRGNHDQRAGDPPEELGIRCVDAPFAEPPFVYRHFPHESREGYVLSGHIHPAIKLYGGGLQRATLPCFYFGRRVGILPAFGGFTGMGRIHPGPEDRVYAIAGDEVIGVSNSD